MHKFILFSVLCLDGFGSAWAGQTNSPQLQCASGWRAEIVAQAPALRSPSVVCCSPDGRIFVGEDRMDMDARLDQPDDRIVCIFPDGHQTIFATNLYAVFGLQYLDGKLYVHHSPKFSVFDDHSGIGVNRTDLITSDNPHPWQPSLNDHIPAGFRLAMDGYFYISTGDKGVLGAVGRDGRQIELHGGGIYRMRPDGTGLEVYATGTRNHIDVAINAADELFTEDNTDDGGGWWSRVTHMVDGGYYGYPYDFKPRQPYIMWTMGEYGSGAATGSICYEEDALPAEYRGNLFLCDWASSWIMRLKIQPDGATYQIKERMQTDGLDFVTMGGFTNSFRPVGITISPDGMSFYVTDWGIAASRRNVSVGRLFKISYMGPSQAAPKPPWYLPAATGQKFTASTAELVQGLSHPSAEVRRVAQRRLAERGHDAAGRVVGLLMDKRAPEYARWSALWTLDAMDAGHSARPKIIAALRDPVVSVASQAARELGTRQVEEAVGALTRMLSSSNAVLRFRAATALGRIGNPTAVPRLTRTLADKDDFVRYAAFTALNRIGKTNAMAWRPILNGLVNSDDQIRQGTLFAVRETYDPALVQTLTEFFHRSGLPLETRVQLLHLLSSLYFQPAPWNGEWWKTMPVKNEPPVKHTLWAGSAAVADVMRSCLDDRDLSLRKIAFDWVESSRNPIAAAQLRELFEHESNPLIRADILRALPLQNTPADLQLLQSLLHDPNTPAPVLTAAVAHAVQLRGGNWDDDLIRLAAHPVNESMRSDLFQIFSREKLAATAPLLGLWLAGSNSWLKGEAIKALLSIGGPAAIAEFRPGLESSSAEVRQQSIEALGALKAKAAVPQLITLAQNPVWTSAATLALAKIADLSALNIYLTGLTSSSLSVRAECRSAIISLHRPALPLIEKELANGSGLSDGTVAVLRMIYRGNRAAEKGPLFKTQIQTVSVFDYQNFALTHAGDFDRGRAIFSNPKGVYCIRCHSIDGGGGWVGPNLTGIGTKQSRAQIIESVLYPSAVILNGYQQVSFAMKNGDNFSGLIRGETDDQVVVLDASGQTNRLQTAEIKSRHPSAVSLMPEGLAFGLSLQQFADLITFVGWNRPSAGQGAVK